MDANWYDQQFNLIIGLHANVRAFSGARGDIWNRLEKKYGSSAVLKHDYRALGEVMNLASQVLMEAPESEKL